jgi:hypothetical protein
VRPEQINPFEDFERGLLLDKTNLITPETGLFGGLPPLVARDEESMPSAEELIASVKNGSDA